MENELLFYFDLFMEQFPTMNPAAKEYTRSILTLKKFSKKAFLYECGEVQNEIAYVCQGLLRKYYINEKGNKINVGFSIEKQWATDYPSFIKQKPSKYYIECLEPSIIITMPYDKLQEAYRTYKDSEMYGRLTAEMVLTRENDRVESFLFENAEERYLHFVSANKDLVNRISLSHLASYLGIERQSLTRIRSKLAKKQL